jgi:hypothetical protein
MPHLDINSPISRRNALALGGGLTAAALLSPAGADAAAGRRHLRGQTTPLPADQIQKIVQAEGTVTGGVLSIDIARSDIGDVKGPLGVTFTGAFQVDGSLTFQPHDGNMAFFNGDLPLLPAEANPFIDALVANGLIFQAFHQHYIEMNPPVWFIHWRGFGDPLKLAKAVHNVLKATATPLPQTMPSHPKTPLDAKRLGTILHGDAQVGDEGVVTVTVQRRGRIRIDGIHVSPEANISSNIQFRPLNGSGTQTAAAPDFSMSTAEVMPVITEMRKQGWFVGCLYNQETGETPQLYFSHMLKVGDPYTLAAEIRRGLDRTNAD